MKNEFILEIKINDSKISSFGLVKTCIFELSYWLHDHIGPGNNDEDIQDGESFIEELENQNCYIIDAFDKLFSKKINYQEYNYIYDLEKTISEYFFYIFNLSQKFEYKKVRFIFNQDLVDPREKIIYDDYLGSSDYIVV